MTSIVARVGTARALELLHHRVPVGLDHLEHHIVEEVVQEVQHPLPQLKAEGERAASRDLSKFYAFHCINSPF